MELEQILGQEGKMALYGSPDYQTILSQLALLVQEFYIDFQDGCHLGFPIRTILTTFDLQVTSILPMVWVNCPFGSGEKVQNRLSTWSLVQPSWISDQNDFSYFFINKSPLYSLSNFKSMGLSIQEKFKIDFQDGNCGVILYFRSERF